MSLQSFFKTHLYYVDINVDNPFNDVSVQKLESFQYNAALSMVLFGVPDEINFTKNLDLKVYLIENGVEDFYSFTKF